MLKNPSTENTIAYKQFRNRLHTLLRNAEREYYKSRLDDNKSNLRKTWNILKEVINKSSHCNIPDTFVINNKLVSNKIDIANSFNKYVVNIGPSLSKNIPNTSKNPQSFMKTHIIESIFLKPVVENEVESLIKNLKSAASGWDSVSSDIIKLMYTYFISPLTHILSLSITKGTFPDSMKIAKVLPLFKSGERILVSNYRPISILPVFSKILQ